MLGSCHLWIIKLLIIISMDKVGFLLSPTPNFLALFHLWIIMSTYMSFCTHVTYNYYVFQQHQRINTWSRLITTFLIFITTQVTLELEKNLCSCISNTVQLDIDVGTTLYVDLQIWWIYIAWKWVFTCTSFWWLLPASLQNVFDHLTF